MDALQAQVHRAALVDGDTYMLIEPPDAETPLPDVLPRTRLRWR
jgi:hypothetical protein